MPQLNQAACPCQENKHQPRFIVLTGGPSAGKTAVLEMVQKVFCQHITIVPESASIIFGGGFFRRSTAPAIKGAQRAIFKIQQELEQIIIEEQETALAICDRGTLDGLAYWPESEASFWQQTASSKAEQLEHYLAVVHLRTPPLGQGYNLDNPVRIESAQQAQAIDQKLLDIWSAHPNRHIIESNANFLIKTQQAIQAIQNYLPSCCQSNALNISQINPPQSEIQS